MLVIFDKVNGRKIVLFMCSNFNETTFTTTTLIGNLNSEHYSAKEISYKTYEITPKVGYTVYEPITDVVKNGADIMSIKYDAGNDIKDIVEVINKNTFIIDDKIPVTYRENSKEIKGRVNPILNYIGLEHIEKPEKLKRYESEMYSKIQLLPECKKDFYLKYEYKTVSTLEI